MGLQKYKGFEVGKEYKTIFDLQDENNTTIPAGTMVRIVAIAEKVCMRPVSETSDGFPYFFNAVVASTGDFWEHYNKQHLDKPQGWRIRANFKALKKGKRAK